MTLFWHPTGPRIAYSQGEGMLYVEDLNPQVKTQWRMSRMDMLRLGLKCIKAALA